MDINRVLRGMAGGMVLLSLLLAVVFSYWWLLLTLFVGANLLQSAFSATCPAMWVLRRMGFRSYGDDEQAKA